METGDIGLSYDVTTLSNPINVLGSNEVHTEKHSYYYWALHIGLQEKERTINVDLNFLSSYDNYTSQCIIQMTLSI